MQFDDVVRVRRSIRGYKPDPVPRALIEEVISLAMRAPSSMNTQPWNFYGSCQGNDRGPKKPLPPHAADQAEAVADAHVWWASARRWRTARSR